MSWLHPDERPYRDGRASLTTEDPAIAGNTGMSESLYPDSQDGTFAVDGGSANDMDLVLRSDLQQLSQRGQRGTHVSLFIPTHRYGLEVEGDQIRWRNLLTATSDLLRRRGMRKPEITKLLAPAWELLEDALAWQYMSDGLAMFLRPGWNRRYRVATELPTLGTVGEHFVTGPLLQIVTNDCPFLLLTVSQRNIRLLKGSQQQIEELELKNVPTSIDQVVQSEEPGAHPIAWQPAPAGGQAGHPIFYGHGAPDAHIKKEEVRRFLQRVATSLHGFVGDMDLPMVPVGLDYHVSMYREVNTYPHLIDEVRIDPDPLSADELHTLAWPVVAQILERQVQQAIQRFTDLHGTGQASNDLTLIEAAAREGRVDTLLVAGQPWCWEHTPTDIQVFLLGNDEAFARCEKLDNVAAETMAHGGRIYARPAREIPGIGDIAAVFRY
jgi:hypothetical protein